MFPIKDTIPSKTFPIVTYTIIGINAFVFFFLELGNIHNLQKIFFEYGVIPAFYTGGVSASVPWSHKIITIFTSMFLHGGFLHFFGNMWTLWIFGDNVEDRLGKWRFILLYLLSGVTASVVNIIFNPMSKVPTIGASGAIAGVLGAYFIFFPFARIIVLVPLIFIPFFFEVPAFLFLIVWFFIQLHSGFLSIVSKVGYENIAWWAHVGGFVAGIVLGAVLNFTVQKRRQYIDEYLPW